MPYSSLNLLCYPDAEVDADLDADLERGIACASQFNLAPQCAWYGSGREAPC